MYGANMYNPNNIHNMRRAPQSAPTQQRRPIKIMMTNKSNKINMELVDFFKKNLHILNKELVFNWIIVYPDEISELREQNIDKFPILIYGGDIEDTRNHIIGLNAIIQFLLGKHNNNGNNGNNGMGAMQMSKKKNKQKGAPPNGGADMHNWMNNQLRGDEECDDEDDEFAGSNQRDRVLQQRMMEMNNIRKSSGLAAKPTNNIAKMLKRKKKKTQPKNNQREEYNNNLDDDSDSDTGEMEVPTAVEILQAQKGDDIDDDLMRRFFENQEETVL
jgi:hypothetical protein